MAATIDNVVLSGLMQDEYASLAAAGASGTSVSTEEMCDALAKAIADHLNATIVASYTAHAHPVNAIPSTLVTTATIGLGSVGLISGETDTTDTP